MVESCGKRRVHQACLQFKVAGETRRVDAMCPCKPARESLQDAPGGSSRLVELLQYRNGYSPPTVYGPAQNVLIDRPPWKGDLQANRLFFFFFLAISDCVVLLRVTAHHSMRLSL